MVCALHNIKQPMKNLRAVISTAPGLPAIWLRWCLAEVPAKPHRQMGAQSRETLSPLFSTYVFVFIPV
jgi:hypothetical protein